MDEKVEENMGTLVGIKLRMNCGEKNVDTKMNVKKKGHKLECKKEEKLDEKRDVNMGQT